jgi:hypothetical protein
MNKCPFKAGDYVIYGPSSIGRDKSLMIDLGGLVPGARYRKSRVEDDVYVVLDGFETSPGGGLYWSEFEPAE